MSNVFILVRAIGGQEFQELLDPNFNGIGIFRVIHLGYRAFGEKALGVAVRFKVKFALCTRFLEDLVRLAIDAQSDQDPDLINSLEGVL